VAARGGGSLWARGAFETPLGSIPVATEFAEALVERCSLVEHDPAAHAREHAVEVELPFLAKLAPSSAIVPIVVAWDDWKRSRELATALAQQVKEWPEDVLLVASSDMTHFESAAKAASKDRFALEAMEHLDAEALLSMPKHCSRPAAGSTSACAGAPRPRL
jgi:AmmeMemoRadiSam system protein B